MTLTSQTPLLLTQYIAERIRLHAEILGLTQSELAREANISRNTVHVAWTGQRLVRADTLAAIALALEIEVGDLFPDLADLRRYL